MHFLCKRNKINLVEFSLAGAYQDSDYVVLVCCIIMLYLNTFVSRNMSGSLSLLVEPVEKDVLFISQHDSTCGSLMSFENSYRHVFNLISKDKTGYLSLLTLLKKYEHEFYDVRKLMMLNDICLYATRESGENTDIIQLWFRQMFEHIHSMVIREIFAQLILEFGMKLPREICTIISRLSWNVRDMPFGSLTSTARTLWKFV